MTQLQTKIPTKNFDCPICQDKDPECLNQGSDSGWRQEGEIHLMASFAKKHFTLAEYLLITEIGLSIIDHQRSQNTEQAEQAEQEARVKITEINKRKGLPS